MAKLTFVLPGDFRSGGVRVTVIMANLLRDRGHDVRIVTPKPPLFGRKALHSLWLKFRIASNKNAGWLHEFKGPLVPFRRLDDLEYGKDEVVIAVGTYSVGHVRAMRKAVRKVRFNHGFPAAPTPADIAAWRGKMPTITVSNTLVPRLQEETEGSVWGVVPNGIDRKQYHIDPGVERIGLGACFNPHPNKDPAILLRVLQDAAMELPDLPQFMFSAEQKPAELPHVNFTRLPSVDNARTIYNRCKIWLLTSRTEGLPGVVLEALACGCVVVSSDNDGSLEILRHERESLIVPKGDAASFLAAIKRLHNDDTLRKQLAAEGQRTIERFTWNAAADRMEAFITWVSDRVKP
ncbi:MAG: glycosyltransferase family 4 protein [Opitutaceae bacterium]|nr:glycosyltransferase family 4 protein [Opitutaceae bacterium]